MQGSRTEVELLILPSRPQAGQEARCGDADAAVGVHRLDLAGQLVGLAGNDGRLGEHSGGCRPPAKQQVSYCMLLCACMLMQLVSTERGGPKEH